MVITKEKEIMDFLNAKVFVPILESDTASESAKTGVRYTIMRLSKLKALGMVKYFWSAMAGTKNSIDFAEMLESEGHTSFEDIYKEFRVKFDDEWLKS